MQLILIRHGETLWNKEKRVQGKSDIELSEAGLEQARRLAVSLKHEDIAAIYSSPLKRARQTADVINGYHGRTIEMHEELMEMSMGDFEGFSFEDLMARESVFLRRWIADPAAVRMPKGETLEELQNRAWPRIEKIIAKEENALVVSHNFTIAAILCRLKNINLSEFRSACVGNASKTVLTIQNNETRIVAMDDQSHLSEPSREI